MTSSDAFGIYVHWPFCKAKCPYCDFNSHVRHEGVDARSFAKALGTELTWFAARTPGRTVTSIFFGGGTPSLMPPEAVGHVLETIASLWSVSPDVEITLEANPTSIEAENFRGYRAAGVNRVSVGVQALNDEDLKALGRQHSSEEAIAAFRLAAKIFPRVSFDMIYARPNQTPEQWRAELTRALAEQQGHMSLYQLTIEPGTAYFDLYERGRLVTPTDDRAAEQPAAENVGRPVDTQHEPTRAHQDANCQRQHADHTRQAAADWREQQDQAKHHPRGDAAHRMARRKRCRQRLKGRLGPGWASTTDQFLDDVLQHEARNRTPQKPLRPESVRSPQERNRDRDHSTCSEIACSKAQRVGRRDEPVGIPNHAVAEPVVEAQN